MIIQQPTAKDTTSTGQLIFFLGAVGLAGGVNSEVVNSEWRLPQRRGRTVAIPDLVAGRASGQNSGKTLDEAGCTG